MVAVIHPRVCSTRGREIPSQLGDGSPPSLASVCACSAVRVAGGELRSTTSDFAGTGVAEDAGPLPRSSTGA
eukprot:733570-Alexandrium_andersonii.AAC.1